MVEIKEVFEIRPKLTDVFPLGEFTPRTPAIADALQWGKELHAGQKRLSGEPYFETHCVWIANFIDHLIGIEPWVIAALLHDSVEDRQRQPGADQRPLSPENWVRKWPIL